MLEDEEVKKSIKERFEKQSNLAKLNDFLAIIIWGRMGTIPLANASQRDKDCSISVYSDDSQEDKILHMLLPRASIHSEIGLMVVEGKILDDPEVFRRIAEGEAHIRKKFGIFLANNVDFENLAVKIKEEQNRQLVIEFVSDIFWLNKELGLKLAKKIDFSTTDEEEFMVIVNSFILDRNSALFQEIYKQLRPDIKTKFKIFLNSCNIIPPNLGS